jgi:hypothetical protein
MTLTTKRLEELQAWLLDVFCTEPLQQKYDDTAEAVGELIARRRVEEARMRAFLANPDGPQAG